MNELAERMNLIRLEQTPEYRALTLKQRLFVAAYCEGGLATGVYDAVQAVFAAYKCKSMETARVMSYSLMGNIRIVAVLNRHFGTSPTEEFFVQLNRAINNGDLSMAQLGALKLKCDLLGIKTSLPDHQSIGVVPPSVVAARKPKKPKKASPIIEEAPVKRIKHPIYREGKV